MAYLICDPVVWVLPLERMKANREHRVPLSDPVIKLLKALHKDSRYVFPGMRKSGLSNTAMLQLLRGLRDDGVTVHGFRSAFST